jgi:cyclase
MTFSSILKHRLLLTVWVLALLIPLSLNAQNENPRAEASGRFSENGAYIVTEWPEFPGVELNTIHVAGNMYMIQRPGGGNIGMYVGAQGVLLVDTLLPAFGERILAEVEKTTDKPILYVVNKHIHIDHIGGNAAIAAEGATIVAHESVRQRMFKPLRWPRHHGSFGPMPPKEARPFITFSEAINFHFEDEDIKIFLAPAAHTDGDAIV